MLRRDVQRTDSEPEADGPLAGAVFAEFLARVEEEGDLESAGLEHLRGGSYEGPAGVEASAEEMLELIGSRGARFARYRIVRQIGEGGMGVVHEVWDDELGRPLAMKQARLGGMDESYKRRVLTRFLEEAQVSARLVHPGILPVHELGLDDEGNVFFTMQLVHGTDLGDLLRRAAERDAEWPRTRLLGVLLRACEALGFAHAHGVIHRDLKPSNIMVGRFGEVYVMDWGLAKVLSAEGRGEVNQGADPRFERPGPGLTQFGDVMGTPAYMSPEQARGHVDRLDRRSDVYSVGALLYHVLVGHEPYGEAGRRPSPHQVLARVLESPPPRVHTLRRDVPTELEAICEKAMSRAAEDRYPDVEALASDLRAFLDGRVVRAHRTGAMAELRKWVGRNRLVAGVSAALVLSLLAGALISSALYSESSRSLSSLRRSMIAVYQGELERLEQEAATLYPIGPERIPAYEHWLTRFRELGASIDALDGALAGEALNADRAARLVELRETLAALRAPQAGLVEGLDPGRGPGIARRLALARVVEAAAADGRSWEEAAAAVGADPRYAGFELAPQTGLVPLGADPRSGLWEFADVRTGEVPERDPKTGALELTPASAVVLVLVPPGRDTVGLQDRAGFERLLTSEELTLPHELVNYEPSETPTRELEFEAFLLSKFELDQAQWQRMAGENPSHARAGDVISGVLVTPLHPVEQVDWDSATEVLGWYGLELPFEAEWEYAARAGTDTLWWTGAEVESLSGRVNLADRSAADAGEAWPTIWPDLTDGWPGHAPVDALAPNAFGLHHVLGNVEEWCAENWAQRYGDGLLPPERPEGAGGYYRMRPMRGGGFSSDPVRVRASARKGVRRDTRASVLGLRPARRLVR